MFSGMLMFVLNIGLAVTRLNSHLANCLHFIISNEL